MKTKSTFWIVLALLVTRFTVLDAGSISGKVTYGGSTAGIPVVVAFPDSTFQTEMSAVAEADTNGTYTLTGLQDGTYYILSIISGGSNNIGKTDPWGVYQISGHLAPVVISGGSAVTGIDIALVDGSDADPNPFYRSFPDPAQVLTLASTTSAGVEPALAYDGTSIYLYKHDYKGAASGKFYTINPANGSVTQTYSIAQQSLANGISWIDNILFVNGTLWGTGGYGDPSGSGYREGMFTINIATSTSGNQIPCDTSVSLATGLASDGTNFYVAVDSGMQRGLIKFNPSGVSKLPTTFFRKLTAHPQSVCFADGYLWVGVDSLRKLDPATGSTLGCINVNPAAAGVFVNSLFWMYDETDNTLKGFTIQGVTAVSNRGGSVPADFVLSQNFPNPFNPTTVIRYSLPEEGDARLSVFDVLGREVSILAEGRMSAGLHTATWDARGLASGIYFYRLQSGKSVETMKLVLMK